MGSSASPSQWNLEGVRVEGIGHRKLIASEELRRAVARTRGRRGYRSRFLLTYRVGIAVCCVGSCVRDRGDGVSVDDVEWAYYGGDSGGSRYSALAQINRSNVAQLEVAWLTRAGDFPERVFRKGHRG